MPSERIAMRRVHEMLRLGRGDTIPIPTHADALCVPHTFRMC